MDIEEDWLVSGLNRNYAQKGALAYLAHAYKYEDFSTGNLRNPAAAQVRARARTYAVLEEKGLITWATKGHPFGREYPIPTAAGLELGLDAAPIHSGCGCWRCRIFARLS